LLPFAAYSQEKENQIFNDSLLKISNISINSIHSDFGPCVINDSLYFTTFNDKLSGSTDLQLRKKEFYDLYKTCIDKNGNPVSERKPVESFITRFNDGPVSWCAKTGELFITQNDPELTEKTKGLQKKTVRLKIVISQKVHGNWSPAVNFPYNSSKYSVGHPAINETGDTLIFTSDIPGGFGETDLYYSVRKNGKWSLPVNLGSRINTSGKDEFPFLTNQHQNGHFLIFSSNGRFGFGGFDLYYTHFPFKQDEVHHFDFPLNTSYDDFSMNLPSDADYGYLTSNRPGKGDDDIYKINFKRIIRKTGENNKITKKFIELLVYDKAGHKPIPEANIISCGSKIFSTDCKGKTIIPLDSDRCEITASFLGYKTQKKLLTSPDKKTLVQDTIWMDMLTNQKIILHNIYYDFNKYNILPEAAKELDRLVSLMNQNPGMNVELSSHTDSRGTEGYNLRLSELRAKAAADYVISKGISKDRIKWKGYGKSRLINKCLEPCTPAQQRENRRTELFIPEFLRGEAVLQTKGDFSSREEKSGLNLINKYKKTDSIFSDNQKNHRNLIERGSLTGSPKAGIIIKNESNVINPQDFKCFIILGSFSSVINAENFLHQLRSDSYKALILNEKDQPVRVGIGYTSWSQVKQSLSEIRKKYQEAWILKATYL
jgi:outer membrane protein OmpA-like peptidoglycan-associated protein